VKQLNYLKLKLHITIIISLLLLLSGCHHKNNLLTGKYQPRLNPRPKYFFTVQGYVAPELRKYVDIKWQAIYVGSDKRCDYVVNSFEGINGSRFAEINYHPIPDANGHYTIHIPLDAYLPGYCKWTVFELDNNLGFGGLSTVTGFLPCGDTNSCNTKVSIGKYNLRAISNIDCRIKSNQSLECHEVKGTTILNDNYITPKNHNYEYLEKFNLAGN
jgi:hypothetical protein